MRDIETMLLDAARWGLEPLRAPWRTLLSSAGQAPVAVLFYHRVADTQPNPWTLSNAAFRAHMEWLVRQFDVVSLDECQRRIASGKNSQPTVAITFDDGYSENCEFAIPWLIERQIPLTYYVTLGHVLSGQPFPHDIARGEPLPVNTLESVIALGECGVEIGAHSRSHPNLGDPALTADQLFDEIVLSTRELSLLIERPVRHFAIPFGQLANVTPEVVRLAREAGLASIATACNAVNLPGDDPFHIARVHGDPNLSRLKNWLAGDPRMIARRRRMDRALGL